MTAAHGKKPARSARRHSGTASLASRDATAAQIADIMRRDVVCVTPEVDIDALMAILVEHEIGGAPVVSTDGTPLGVVSKTDVVRACYEGRGGASVAEIMTPIALVLPSAASVGRAAALMAVENVHRVLVMESGAIVGILSSLDVLRWLGSESGYLSAS